MHHIKDIILTVIPGLAGYLTALEVSNSILGLVIGSLTAIWLMIRIAIAWKEYKPK